MYCRLTVGLSMLRKLFLCCFNFRVSDKSISFKKFVEFLYLSSLNLEVPHMRTRITFDRKIKFKIKN